MPSSILPQDKDGQELFNAISSFFCTFGIGNLLRKCNAQKEKGIPVLGPYQITQTSLWERPERRSIQRGKHAFPGTRPVLEILFDKFQDTFPYIVVQSVKAVIQLTFQPFKEPGLKPADAGFHRRFVFWFADPCRYDRYLVVSGQRHVCLIEFRVVKARMDDGGLTVIRHEDPWEAAIP